MTYVGKNPKTNNYRYLVNYVTTVYIFNYVCMAFWVLWCNNRHVFSSLKSIYIYICTYFCHSECIVLPFVWGLRGLLTWQMSGLFKHFTSINVIIIIIIIWLFSLTDFASYEPLVERLCVVFTTEWDYQWTIHFCYTQSYSVCELW